MQITNILQKLTNTNSSTLNLYIQQLKPDLNLYLNHTSRDLKDVNRWGILWSFFRLFLKLFDFLGIAGVDDIL